MKTNIIKRMKMESLNTTITIDELQALIEDAVYKATTSVEIGNYELITEKELSKRLNLSKVTLHKYRKEGMIPYINIGRTIRYNFSEVVKSMNNRK
jgi:excisionase family DNA binding protein